MTRLIENLSKIIKELKSDEEYEKELKYTIKLVSRKGKGWSYDVYSKGKSLCWGGGSMSFEEALKVIKEHIQATKKAV